MDLHLVQSHRFPNVWTLREKDSNGPIVQIFRDKMDPNGSYAVDAAEKFAKGGSYAEGDPYRIIARYPQPASTPRVKV